MKKNKKYLKASVIVSTQYSGVCDALSKVRQPSDYFDDIFKPTLEDSLMWNPMCSPWYFGLRLNEENKLARSLALLFMYEMGEK